MTKCRMRTSVALTVGVLTLAATAAAQTTPAQAPPRDPHAAQPERPTVATHAGTVAPGWFELETGTEFDTYPDKTFGASSPTLLKIGVGKRLQLSVQTPLVQPAGTTHTGFGDLAVGMKWRVLEDAPILGDFAILPSIKLPTGSVDTGDGTGTTDAGFLLISSHQFGPVAMDLNAGVTFRSGDGSNAPKTATVWTASFGGPAAGKLGWCAELFGFPATSGPAGSDSVVAVLAGPTFTAREWIVFDAGVIMKLTGDQPTAFYAGLTWNIGGIK